MTHLNVNFLFFDAALEIIPKTFWKHKTIAKKTKKNTVPLDETLLDVSEHLSIVKQLKESHRRGRPDILHISLLQLLHHPLLYEFNKNIRIFVHTRNDIVFEVPHDWRIPINYYRFKRIIGQLLKYGTVPPKAESPILIAKKIPLQQLFQTLADDTILLTSHGVYFDLKNDSTTFIQHFGLKEEKKRITFCIGAFQRGQSPRPELKPLFHASIYHSSLPAWIVTSILADFLYFTVF